MLHFLKPYMKAVVAAVAPIVVGLGAKYGLELDVDNVVLVLLAVLTSAGVYSVPNKAVHE